MKRTGGAMLAAWLALAGTALAAVEEGAQGHEAHSPVAMLVFSTINLLIFLWLLSRFALPGVRYRVRGRRERVVQALEQAAAAKKEAERLRAEWEQRLAEFDATVAEMRAQARRDSERDRDRILDAARKTAEAIRRDAELAAAYELRRTQEQLRAELVRQALHLAEAAARTQLTAADQERFVAEFLKQVQA